MYRYEVDVETFYDKYIEYNRDFKYVVVLTLVSRNSDNEDIYNEIEEKWHDLHDLTGNKVLFAFVGKNDSDRPESICKCGKAFFNRVVSFFGNEQSLKDIINGQQYTCSTKALQTTHSAQIRKIKDKLNITERQVPCLHVLFVPNKASRLISLRDLDSVSIYDLVKQLMICWEPLLREYELPSKEMDLVLSNLGKRYYFAKCGTQQILEDCSKIKKDDHVLLPIVNQLQLLLRKQTLDMNDKKSFGKIHKTLKLLGFRNLQIGKLHQYIDLKLIYGSKLDVQRNIQESLDEKLKSNARDLEYVTRLSQKVDDTIYWLEQLKKKQKCKTKKLADNNTLDGIKNDLLDSFKRDNSEVIALLNEQKVRTNEIMSKLDCQYLSIIDNINFAINNNNVSENELNEILLIIQRSLEKFLILKPEFASEKSIIAVKDTFKSVDLTAAGKVKLTVPIIPALLTYESEWSVSGKESFSGLWEKLRSKFGSNRSKV